MTIRTSITDLPNPAKRIGEPEAELLRVRAALEDQHASTDALWNENTALRAEVEQARADAMALSKFSRQHERERDEYKYQRDVITDALRARAEQAEAALSWWEADSVAGRAREYYSGLEKDNADLRARLQECAEVLAYCYPSESHIMGMDDWAEKQREKQYQRRKRFEALRAALAESEKEGNHGNA